MAITTGSSKPVPDDQLHALAIIADEHRSLAAVLHGLEFLVREARDHGSAPSFPLLLAMLHYIKAFPETLHHPKEDTYLFFTLRTRTGAFDAILDELERHHVESHALVDELELSIRAYEADPSGGLARFAFAVERFASSQTAHMALESTLVIPGARKLLTDEDWAEIGAAFASNGDPRFSADNDEEFRQLFARIMNLAPNSMLDAAQRSAD